MLCLGRGRAESPLQPKFRWDQGDREHWHHMPAADPGREIFSNNLTLSRVRFGD